MRSSAHESNMRDDPPNTGTPPTCSPPPVQHWFYWIIRRLGRSRRAATKSRGASTKKVHLNAKVTASDEPALIVAWASLLEGMQAQGLHAEKKTPRTAAENAAYLEESLRLDLAVMNARQTVTRMMRSARR